MSGFEHGSNFDSWREYQRTLKRKARRRYYFRRLPVLGAWVAGIFLVLGTIFYSGGWVLDRIGAAVAPRGEELSPSRVPERIERSDLPGILEGKLRRLDPIPQRATFVWQGKTFTLETSVETDLQDYTENLLERSLTYEAAVVVLRPDTGRVLTMADFRSHTEGERRNLCLAADFPAASLFKVISAAAVIEKRDFTPGKTLAYQGGKYTLYKSQLKEGKGRYSREISFKRAFSRSVNPVFGKIGMYELGGEALVEYAERFLFNTEIPFDIPLAASITEFPRNDFAMAEVASGFNKRTLISPLHAALITATVANDGIMMAPWVVKCVRDESGMPLYFVRPSKVAEPVGADTARTLRELMEETVSSGTCRKAFRPLERNRRFKDVKLGAKTGTINDPGDRYKFDWLTAYALPGNGDHGICIAVLAVHGKKLGIRAKDLARHILEHHFAT